MAEDGLVKLHVALPNHPGIGGESFWAEDLGEDHYKIENVPFFAYGLNFRDIVHAVPDHDGIIEIQSVIKKSGNKTMRVRFSPSYDKKTQDALLNELWQLHCSFERWDESNLALNIKSQGDIHLVFEKLVEWADKDILDFETAHERVEGTFDDTPE